MRDLETLSRNISNSLLKKGYTLVKTGVPKGFTWRPDLLFKQKKELIAVLIRETNSIPLVLLQRVASTKITKEELKIFISFCKKPTSKTISDLKTYGIGLYEFKSGNLKGTLDPKNFSSFHQAPDRVAQPLGQKMQKTDIFISSQQEDFEERFMAKNTIIEMQRTDHFPIYPVLVEDDARFTIDQTEECINENIKSCEWFLCILAEEFRPVVEKEVKKAFKKPFEPENIMIFIKRSPETEKAWEKLIIWIEQKNTVKYMRYLDITDLKLRIDHGIRVRVEKIHERLNIPMYN